MLRTKYHQAAGVTLIEVLVASAILAISAVSIMDAFAAATKTSTVTAMRQQAQMLAGNLLEEIRNVPNFDPDCLSAGKCGNANSQSALAEDQISKSASPVFLETGEQGLGRLNSTGRVQFDDKTDYAMYMDGPGFPNPTLTSPQDTKLCPFYSYYGEPIPLMSSDNSASLEPMIRYVEVNILNEDGDILPNGSERIDELAAFVSVSVRIYEGSRNAYNIATFTSEGLVETARVEALYAIPVE
ncbi:MAG: hypothetical protein HJJLKODD_01759 [Phycisphaerae bacterium]|nr:hypothetical protein [Phycisphaerae bacterium]